MSNYIQREALLDTISRELVTRRIERRNMTYSNGYCRREKDRGRPSSPALAVLLQGFSLDTEPRLIRLEPGITLGCFENTVEKRLYQRLCVEDGIDDGAPLDYEVYARFTPDRKLPFFVEWDTPDSLVGRICNLLTVVLGSPIGMCRAIWSKDEFASAQQTEIVFVTRGQTEWIRREYATISPLSGGGEIALAWQNAKRCFEQTDQVCRLSQALEYFYYAWRAASVDQICLNLGITLRILFGPQSNSSRANPPWVNAADFPCASVPRMKRSVFTQRVCELQSQISDGRMPDLDMLIVTVYEVFPFVADVLKTILLDEDLALEFAGDTDTQS